MSKVAEMDTPEHAEEPDLRFADAIRSWRSCRRLSQLRLAERADVSSRHLSFLETGRARPSRNMVLKLAHALRMSQRDTNALLLAAGFAPRYAARSLDDLKLRPAWQGIEFLLRAHEPFPAFVVDRCWNILEANWTHRKMLAWMLDGRELPSSPHNALDLVLDPALLRSAVRNWTLVATVLVRRLRQKLETPQADGALLELEARIAKLPGIDRLPPDPPALDPTALLIPIELEVHGIRLSWFSTLATFGAPVDMTLEEITIESLHPADETTRRFATSFASQ